jgi:hypothetical protein
MAWSTVDRTEREVSTVTLEMEALIEGVLAGRPLSAAEVVQRHAE